MTASRQSKPRPYAVRFARNVVRCRKDAGLSQEELAKRAGLDRVHVSLFEQAKRVPQLDTLIKLAGGLGVAPPELLRGIAWEPTTKREGSFRVDDDSAPG